MTKGYISITGHEMPVIREEFKGETFDKESQFPKGLGAEHPFDFKSVEDLTKRCGQVAGIINKWTDSIVGEFEVKLKNENSQALINSFLHSSNFYLVLREWIREGLAKGNGFMEIDLTDQKVRIMNANGMYVKRNKKGKVLKYSQWTRPFKQFNRDSQDMIEFQSNQIAHLIINKTPNEPYGIGIIWPNERIIQNLIINEQDLQKLTSRKAGMPYHIKVGQPGDNVPTSVVDDINSKLQYLTTRTEWVTDGDVDIKILSFGELGKNLTETNMYWFRQLLSGTEMPEVMMGSGQLNEGIALTQLQTFKRKIQAYRVLIASVIEEKIIRPLLRANDLDEVPEFVWELPTEEDINERMTKITEMLKLSMLISPMLKAQLEIELASLLGFEELKDILKTPDEAEQEANIPQPEVPGAKPMAKELREQYYNYEFKDEVPQEGWVTGDDGRHYYIDDNGVSHSGEDAMFVGNRDKNWKPSMSQKEADEWAKDSIAKETYYHGTDKDRLKSIENEGLINHGRGIYFAEDENYASLYGSEGGGTELKVKINSKKIYDTDYKEMDTTKNLIPKIQEEGYDGYRYKRIGSSRAMARGKGNIIVLFNNKAVTVIK